MTKLNHFYNMDCIQGMKEHIPDNFVSLICTSPPYFNARDYSNWSTYEDYLIWLKEVFLECFRVLEEGRMCVVNISPIIVPREGRQYESKRLNLPAHFCVIMEEIGFKFLEDIIWKKGKQYAKGRSRSFHQHRQPVAYKPSPETEYIYVFQKPAPFLIDKIVRGYQGATKEQSLVLGEYDLTNVWEFPPTRNKNHPAPYPVELSDRVVKYYSYVNDTVVDPFMGSGTTAVSCVANRRNYIGFELHEKYLIEAQRRIHSLD